MRIVNFAAGDAAHLGVRVGDEVVDLPIAAPHLPKDLRAMLEAGPEALAAAKKAAESAGRDGRRTLAGLRYLPPVHNPSKIVCLGTNYLGHVLEAGLTKPDFPPIFLRGSSTLLGHLQPMIKPRVSDQLDFEAELAIVISSSARHVKKEDALKYVGGYSCFNDGSIRDFQLRTSQWTLGKNFDDTGGFGPEFVTVDELPEGASGLRIQTRLNGEVMQDSNTKLMIFGVADCIAILTECMTLNPGDVIISGTCEGVGLLRKPPVFMKPGDRCEIDIEGIGVLVNPIAAEAG
jgi:2-keto-4-pentenoate hydratase/2-oxohepta-3-ene-1,7-dioic acid hydratase in catechol pathway